MSKVQTATASRPSRVAAARPGPPRGGDTSARQRPAPAAYAVDDFAGPVAPGGLPYRMAMAALQNPLMTGAVLVSLVATVAIVSNALSNQARRHPAPLFQTRPFAVAPSATAPVVPGAATATPSADPVTTMALPKAKPRPDPAPLVRDIQVALKERGLYAGPIDGIPGPATADSIRAMEKLAGLAQTGEPSERVLAAAQSRAATAGHAAPAGQPAATPVRTTAITPPAPLGRSSGPEPLAAGGDERLQRVQRALLAAGYGPLRTDGKTDDRTQEAIRRYEMDRGWLMTGKLSDRLVLDVMVQAAGQPVR